MLPNDWWLLVGMADGLDRLTTLYQTDGCPVDADVLAEDGDDGLIWVSVECFPELPLNSSGLRGLDYPESPIILNLQLRSGWLRDAVCRGNDLFLALCGRDADDKKYVLVIQRGLVQAIADPGDFHLLFPCGPLRLMAGGVESPVYQPLGHANDDQQEAA